MGRPKVPQTDGKRSDKRGWPLLATTSILKKRSALAKQQDTSKNEVTRFEEKVHEVWKLLQRLHQFHERLVPKEI